MQPCCAGWMFPLPSSPQRAQPDELERIRKHYDSSDQDHVKLLDKPEQWVCSYSTFNKASKTSIINHTVRVGFCVWGGVWTGVFIFDMYVSVCVCVCVCASQVLVWAVSDPRLCRQSSLRHLPVCLHGRHRLRPAQGGDCLKHLPGRSSQSGMWSMSLLRSSQCGTQSMD